LIRVRAELERRLRVFINLPLASLDRLSAKRHVDDIGQARENTEENKAPLRSAQESRRDDHGAAL
jgi:hypothetical protein